VSKRGRWRSQLGPGRRPSAGEREREWACYRPKDVGVGEGAREIFSIFLSFFFFLDFPMLGFGMI